MKLEIIAFNRNVILPETQDCTEFLVHAFIKDRADKFTTQGSKFKFENNKIILKPGGRISVPTGLFIFVEKGWKGTITPLEDLAKFDAVTMLNCVSTFNSSCKKELEVIIVNHSDNNYIIEHNQPLGKFRIDTEHEFQWSATTINGEILV